MRLVEVIGSKLENEFIDFPKRLYKDDPEYVMPLDKDIKAVFDENKNEVFDREGLAIRWLLVDQSETIGRIAAFKNKTVKGEWEGGAGFFECIDSQEAANMLFNSAAIWLKKEGFTKMQAPINFGERDVFWGLLIDGFKNPSYQENYNFPYYQKLMENYGFVKTIEQSTHEIRIDEFNFERFNKLGKRVLTNDAYSFKYLDLKQADSFADDFVTIYNRAWSTHDFFVPITKKLILDKMKEMKPVVTKGMSVFAYNNGEPVAFFINILDINQVLKKVKGKLNLIGKIKFLLSRSKINKTRSVVFGIVPEFRNKGVEVGMIMKFHESVVAHPVIDRAELAWIGDFNPKMLSLLESLGATRTKVHITYEIDFNNVMFH